MSSELLKKIGTLIAAVGFVGNGVCKVVSAGLEVKAAGGTPMIYLLLNCYSRCSVLVVKNPHANSGGIRDMGSVYGSEDSPGGKHGNLLQYSFLENLTERGAWWATAHGVAQSWAQ